ncbi:uncharacterized protein LOC134135933 [Rhea pennata]|uniref:uncharacterized protein LOC134135933 n=1 Tax=Rhea pennata TaxID=8795 RepID=UPI002E25506C
MTCCPKGFGNNPEAYWLTELHQESRKKKGKPKAKSQKKRFGFIAEVLTVRWCSLPYCTYCERSVETGTLCSHENNFVRREASLMVTDDRRSWKHQTELTKRLKSEAEAEEERSHLNYLKELVLLALILSLALLKSVSRCNSQSLRMSVALLCSRLKGLSSLDKPKWDTRSPEDEEQIQHKKHYFLPLPWKEFAVPVPEPAAHLRKPRAMTTCEFVTAAPPPASGLTFRDSHWPGEGEGQRTSIILVLVKSTKLTALKTST